MELKTPFGSFFPPNISPDSRDGIGGWTAADFADALMAGVSPRGEHLYPAFPYPSYRRMSIKDVRDLFAFLHTTPPISGRAPSNALKFPFSIRRAVGFWKLLYMPTIDPPPAVDPTDAGGARPLPRQWAWPLRRMPFAARLFRRDHRLAPPDRGPAAGRQGQGAEHHRRGPQGLVRRRRRNRALDRLHPVGRRARQRHDRGRSQPQAGSASRTWPRSRTTSSPTGLARRPDRADQTMAVASERIRSTIERTPFDRCGVRCCSRPSSRKAPSASIAQMRSGG